MEYQIILNRNGDGLIRYMSKPIVEEHQKMMELSKLHFTPEQKKKVIEKFFTFTPDELAALEKFLSDNGELTNG